jgi:hypothetical protein
MTDTASDERPPGHAALPHSVRVEDLLSAITRSGYPLQDSVTNKLLRSFNDIERYPTVLEEWAYLDIESSQVRSIDVFAELPLSKRGQLLSVKVRPYMNLLAECKQSDMPYIFFLRRQSPSQIQVYPEIGGLPHADIAIFPKIDERVSPVPYLMSPHDLLAFWDLPFFAAPWPLAISVAKVARKGKILELTGEDAYRSLTLPLMKAADHLKKISQPQGTADAFAFRMIVCLAVLRAPMFGAFRTKDTEEVLPLPWVRVCRLEPWQSGLPFRTTSNVRYYDVVHEDYFPEYMTRLIKDAKSIAVRAGRPPR